MIGLFVEGKTLEPLQQLAARFPHPYRIWTRPQQGLYLLEVWGVMPPMVEAAQQVEGFRSWTFELLEEGDFGGEPLARGD